MPWCTLLTRTTNHRNIVCTLQLRFKPLCSPTCHSVQRLQTRLSCNRMTSIWKPDIRRKIVRNNFYSHNPIRDIEQSQIMPGVHSVGNNGVQSDVIINTLQIYKFAVKTVALSQWWVSACGLSKLGNAVLGGLFYSLISNNISKQNHILKSSRLFNSEKYGSLER